jgi:NADH-quinone oxidoreductase subunit N
MPDFAFRPIAPPLMILYGMLMVLLLEIFSPRDTRRAVRNLPPALALVTLLFGLAAVALRWPRANDLLAFSGMVSGDRLALFAQGVLCLAGAFGVLSAWTYLRVVEEDQGEYYALLLAAVFGGMLMAGAADLIVLFLGLEILSISLYVMAGFLRRRVESGESAMKYFFLGAFSTGFLLYGIALVFGATGSTSLAAIGEKGAAGNLMLSAGVALLLVGFGFKIAAFPFHVWTPDVYQGAPSPATGFMAAAVKAAAFAALVRTLAVAFGSSRGEWATILYYVAIATMIFGNVAALVQNRLKRLLAYSAIAHAGYLLVGVTAMFRQDVDAAGAVLFYLAVYGLATIGAFAAVAHLSRRDADADDLDSYRGLARRRPWLAAALAVYLISLAGLPPLAGFVGKFLLFAAAVQAHLLQLAIVGMLTSAISVYYYVRVIYILYMTEPEAGAATADAAAADAPGHVALWAAGLLVLALGVVPQWLIARAGEAAAMLFGK